VPRREKGPVSELQNEGTIAAIEGTVQKGQNARSRRYLNEGAELGQEICKLNRYEPNSF
jgi:hypothetical protein